MKQYSPFRFKYFEVAHQQSPMKVGTDAVVLGALATHPSPERMLDIGTGCGILALLLAQRFPDASITAVEKHGPSAKEAAHNFSKSPFADRIQLHQGDIFDFVPNPGFDLIVCNPPFYKQHGASLAAANRLHARNRDAMPTPALLAYMRQHLQERGSAWLIWPWKDRDYLLQNCMDMEWDIQAQIPIVDQENAKAPERVVVQLGAPVPALVTQLVLKDEQGKRSPHWDALTLDIFPY